MRTNLRSAFLAALVFCWCAGLQAQGKGEGRSFSVDDFAGDWAWTCHGDVVVFGVGQFPLYCVGQAQFDRAGNMRTRRTSSFGGTIMHRILEGELQLDLDGSGLGTLEYTEYEELADGSKGSAQFRCVDRIAAVSRDEIFFMGISCSTAEGIPLAAAPAAGGVLKRQGRK